MTPLQGHRGCRPRRIHGGTFQVRGNPEAEWCTTMVIVTVLALLAVFSLVSIMMSAEDPRVASDPRDNPLLWVMLSRR